MPSEPPITPSGYVPREYGGESRTLTVTRSRNIRNTMAYRARKAAKGLCTYGGCTMPARPGLRSCSEHGHRPHWLPRLCLRLGCNHYVESRWRYCSTECRRMGHREARNLISKRYYTRLKLAGLCVKCRKPVSGRVYCKECTQSQRGANK